MDDGGRRLAGRYELREVIGRGGMGTVYRGLDLVLGREVAVKVLPGLIGEQDPISVARFEREARAAAALSDPAVVAVYDTGADEAARFIVMELVSGSSLEGLLRDGPLEPARAVNIAARVAAALAAAHSAGIVHRDIKPANVMVAGDGTVKVLDFGIARAQDATTLTQSSSVLGTAAYMSPEQALGKPADERSDIYALGCVLYALLAGGPPFTGEAAAAILHQHAATPAPPLPIEHGRISPELNALVLQMLAKSPQDRPQSAAQVRDRLATAADGLLSTPTAVTLKAPAETAPTRPLIQAAPSRRRWVIAALAALAVLIAVIELSSSGSSPFTTAQGVPARSTPTAPAAKAPGVGPRTTSAETATSAATVRSPTTRRPAARPLTVAGAAGALTTLITDGVQSGLIDQDAAHQLANPLADILNSFEMGHTSDALHKVSDLSQHAAMLEQKGSIRSGAAPPINMAIANLGTALSNAAGAAQASVHGNGNGHGHGHGNGNGNGNGDQHLGKSKHDGGGGG